MTFEQRAEDEGVSQVDVWERRHQARETAYTKVLKVGVCQECREVGVSGRHGAGV